jgi:hypothetical protein
LGKAAQAGFKNSIIPNRYCKKRAVAYNHGPIFFKRSAAIEVGAPSSVFGCREAPVRGFDSFTAIQFPLVAGIVLGSAAFAVWLKEFSIHFGAQPLRTG